MNLRRKMAFGSGKLSYLEALGLLIVMASMYDLVFGIQWLASTFYGSLIAVTLGLGFIVFSGKGGLKTGKYINVWEIIGVLLIYAIVFMYGFMDLSAIQTHAYRVISLVVTFLTSYVIAMRD
ncbi:hypothetical protein HNP86_001598 [Methanococcus maripaludis]|uniref:Uncharacterized protein n=1 Tax=Methanococcus maripaludis TaxID=39152 RepID=A0A7J9NW01_METMI|nr:hypothetical protein [Methanococcus maripaludis]MBA2851445.1 hypothetical protein [Methanococcus maripaludis]